MKILFTGGGTGGHFYPIIAIAEEIRNIARAKRLLDAQLYFMSDDPYNAGMLYDNNIIFKRARSGKIRRYFSIKNFFDIFKTVVGTLGALWQVFTMYPDVVFGKGGYASFPALFAARILRIPVIIHESDSEPGRANAWAARFARRIAISYPESVGFFPEDKVAYTGQPVRKGIIPTSKEGAHAYLKLDPALPTILVIGGSQGSQTINETLIDALPEILKKYQVVHQTGKRNIQEVEMMTKVMLTDPNLAARYRPFDYLNDQGMRMAASIADLIISRAGSSIFEIALWGVPSIIIPIPETISHDQRQNAFNYARTGAAIVIEEHNLTPNILRSEIDRILENPELGGVMRLRAREFSRSDAAEKIATEILNIALEHEV